MQIFKYTKHKFDNGSEESIMNIHPILSALILIGAGWGIVTAIKVIFEAFV